MRDSYPKCPTSLFFLLQRSCWWLGVVMVQVLVGTAGAESPAELRFHQEIEPILVERCYDCHANGMEEGSVAFDRFATTEELLSQPELWYRALRMMRAKMMPPADMPQLLDAEFQSLESWIKSAVFHSDPQNPDPGHVTLRRLNRTEYRNTIRDLLGVDYDTHESFPQDDTGHGFDNIGSVLSISPLLLEKYLDAARKIVSERVPTPAKVMPEVTIPGQFFRPEGQADLTDVEPGPLWQSYYIPAWISHEFVAEHAGKYQLQVNLKADGDDADDEFDYNKCRFTFSVDGEEKLNQEFARQGGKPYQFEYEVDWQPGAHPLTFELTPLTPEAEQKLSLTIRITSVVVRGPFDESHWVQPANYRKFLPRDVPTDAADRTAYAREILNQFATRAYRCPVDDETVNRLALFVDNVSNQPGSSFEAGIAEAMTAVLASPSFLFREERVLEPTAPGEFAILDDYSLASRLSYFLWSTMPDEELFRLASENKLRENLVPQLERMLNDQRSQEFIRNFVGQWLRARNVETAIINGPEIMQRDQAPDLEAIERRDRFWELQKKDPAQLTPSERVEIQDFRKRFRARPRKFEDFELGGGLRHAMRRETEMVFEHLIREDRSLLELLDSETTFLNETLAKHYGIEGVTGDEMREVQIPPGSPRGGILTQGTMLVVTSNPDRTSPVKRGLYVLENILGIPPPPPPPNVPALEDAGDVNQKLTLSVAESLALHREQPLCSSCHNRMDPLGLVLEDFNALGLQRTTDHGKPIVTRGKLISGEEFDDIHELKQILIASHRHEFYRCLTEKLFIYALGRGIDYHDTETIDIIVNQLETQQGRPSVLLRGIVQSAAFQKSRVVESEQKPTAFHSREPTQGARHVARSK